MVSFMPFWVEKRVTMISATLFVSIAYLLAGPSKMFHFPDSLVILGIGLAMVGIFSPFMMIPALPEMTEVSSERFPT